MNRQFFLKFWETHPDFKSSLWRSATIHKWTVNGASVGVCLFICVPLKWWSAQNKHSKLKPRKKRLLIDFGRINIEKRPNWRFVVVFLKRLEGLHHFSEFPCSLAVASCLLKPMSSNLMKHLLDKSSWVSVSVNGTKEILSLFCHCIELVVVVGWF